MAGAGGLVLVEMNARFPWNTASIGDVADPKGLAPSAFPQTTGCSAIELRVQMVGSGGNAPLVTSDFVFRHWFYRPAAGTLPLKLIAGVGVTPT